MPRPSGECNGQPCFTAADIQEIQDELAVANDAKNVAQDALNVAQQNYNAAEGLVMQLEMELQQAQMNQCPS